MNLSARSFLLFLLIAALPLFLFLSFYAAFQARDRERAITRSAHADAALVVARSDGVLREALTAVARLPRPRQLPGPTSNLRAIVPI